MSHEQIRNRFTGEIMCGGLSLEEVLKQHKKWLLGDKDGARANLYRANLYRANLYRANLTDANLSGAYLSGADLYRANLADANLSGAYLIDVNLSGADLSGADLSRANLSSATLSSANLSSANLSGAVKAYGYTFTRLPIQLSDRYPIQIWQGFMKIGCEGHLIFDWIKFPIERIIEMDGKPAAKWWKKWKPILLAMAEATDRMELPEQEELKK